MKARTALIWVCVDCMLVHANGECDPDRPTDQPEPWAAVGDDVEITMGMLRSEHADGCDPDDECDCEVRTFSWSRCDGCGSGLGGERHAFTIWFD